jgi:hypothetical protein
MDKKDELNRVKKALNEIASQKGISDFAISSTGAEIKMAYHIADGGAKVFLHFRIDARFVIDEKKPKAQEVQEEPKKKKLKA